MSEAAFTFFLTPKAKWDSFSTGNINDYCIDLKPVSLFGYCNKKMTNCANYLSQISIVKSPGSNASIATGSETMHMMIRLKVKGLKRGSEHNLYICVVKNK